MLKRTLLSLSVLLAAGAAAPAFAQIGDPAIDGAIASGQIGEQSDGYLGVVTGQSVSADVRARMEQINIRRRSVYTERAQQRNVTVDEMARATGCTLLAKNTPSGALYRNEAGSWTRNSGGVALPSYCPR